jgi:hypothetical protein
MYIIKSPRLGVVGTEFVPKPGVQVAGLIWAGFIEEITGEATDEVSTQAPKKSAKNKKATKED